jgi:hypothetical protein
MNKIFDEKKISTFRDLKDLATSNKLVDRREIRIGIDERAIEELRSYIFKANLFDEYLTAKCDSYEKYWKQANRDIQAYEKELREYVASLLYDNDYKSKEIERLNNIINTFEEEIELELSIAGKDALLEDNTYITITDTLQKVLKRIKELKEGK